MSELEMIYLPWAGVHVPRHLHTLVMLRLENLENRHPDVLPELLQLARDPGHEPPLEARRVLDRLMTGSHELTRAIVLDSEYARGVEASRAAQVMTTRLGTEVTADGVAELWRRGLIPINGENRDAPLFDRVAIGRFADADLAAEATRAGRMLGPDEAAAYLEISRAAFDLLVNVGDIRPCRRIWEPQTVYGPDGSLYITCDLDRAARDPGVRRRTLMSASSDGRLHAEPAARSSEAPPDSPWFCVPCSPHCRCRLRYETA